MALRYIGLTLAFIMTLAAGPAAWAQAGTVAAGPPSAAVKADTEIEGEGEGEGEGEVPVTITEVTLLSPTGDIATAPGIAQVPVLLCAEVTLAEDAPAGTVPAVVFEWNGQELPATLRDGLYWAESVAPAGFQGTITAAATVTGEETEYLSDPYPFAVRTVADDNGNGYPDDPFTALAKPGDTWYGLHTSGDCVRVVGMLEMDSAVPECRVLLANPYDSANTALVSVPGALMGAAGRGILTAVLACNEDGMFAPDAAGPDVSLRPGDSLEGGGFLFAGVVVSSDGGATFGDPDPYLAARNAVTFSVAGLRAKPGNIAAWHAFPALLDSDPASGFFLAPADGAWDRAPVLTVGDAGGVFSGRMQEAQLVAPFQTGLPARLEIPEAAGGSVLFGRVRLGETGTLVLTLRNPGSAPVAGTVALSDPAGVFAVRGPLAYSVPAGAEATMEVQFVPPAEEDYRGVLTFTGGENTPLTVTLLGSGTAEEKRVSFFGCGPARGAAAPGWGELLALAMVFALLLRPRRVPR